MLAFRSNTLTLITTACMMIIHSPLVTASDARGRMFVGLDLSYLRFNSIDQARYALPSIGRTRAVPGVSPLLGISLAKSLTLEYRSYFYRSHSTGEGQYSCNWIYIIPVCGRATESNREVELNNQVLLLSWHRPMNQHIHWGLSMGAGYSHYKVINENFTTSPSTRETHDTRGSITTIEAVFSLIPKRKHGLGFRGLIGAQFTDYDLAGLDTDGFYLSLQMTYKFSRH